MQKSIPCVIMRGGTSKGVYFKASDLPTKKKEELDKIILAIFGSPDPMQIDGLGGTHSHTSKTMIVTPSSKPDIDVEYTFGQVAIEKPLIDYGGNCGNLTSAVGPFAINEGLVEPEEPITSVVLYNTNTEKTIIAEVPVENGWAKTRGDFSIDGVPGTAAKIVNRYLDPGGSVTGSLFPTGNLVDELDIEEGEIKCSIVDATNPVVFVKAADIGLTGKELPAEINSNQELLRKLEGIRSQAAEVIRIVEHSEEATDKSPGIPKMAFVAEPQGYTNSLGEEVRAEEINLLPRIMSMQKAHHAYAMTGAMCTAAAAKLEGTVVNEVARIERDEVTIGHPKGKITVEVKVEEQQVKELIVTRTARRLMKGKAYYSI